MVAVAALSDPIAAAMARSRDPAARTTVHGEPRTDDALGMSGECFGGTGGCRRIREIPEHQCVEVTRIGNSPPSSQELAPLVRARVRVVRAAGLRRHA